MFGTNLGYFDVGSSDEFIIPQNSASFTALSNIGLGPNEWVPFFGEQSVEGWDLSRVQFEPPQENINGADLAPY